jgi:hypothetical protein
VRRADRFPSAGDICFEQHGSRMHTVRGWKLTSVSDLTPDGDVDQVEGCGSGTPWPP